MDVLTLASAVLQAFSVQMHIHGSLSEGIGSWHSATVAAQEVGIDVLWWSDHEYGIFHLRTPTTFSFDSFSEFEWENEIWTPHPSFLESKKFLSLKSATGNYTTDFGLPALQGQHSMRIVTDGEVTYGFEMDRNASTARSLVGDTAIAIAVLPTSGTAAVTIELSKHPIDKLRLRYYLSNTDEPWREGHQYNIPVPYASGEWNQLVLPVTTDAIAGFPELQGEDNSMTEIFFSVSDGEVRLDDLRIVFNTAYPETFTRQFELLQELETEIPDVVQLQGVEQTVNHHVNIFSIDTEVYVPNGIANLVTAVHAKKGLVSLNHPLGPGANSQFMTREEILDRLLQNSAYDVDILEVGYRSRGIGELEDFLWIWDELAKRDIHLVGTGVSDVHNWGPGINPTNNFVSWIWAESASKVDLLHGLRSGRVFFGDITLFDGTVDIISASGHMGQKVLDADALVLINGLKTDDRVSIIRDGRKIETFPGALEVRRRVFGPGCIRAEVYTANGEAKVFSNPICLLDPTQRIP